MKRGFDLLLASGLMFPLTPLFILIGWFVRRDSAGPVFYRGIRSGLGGRPFLIYKFRTMDEDAEKMGANASDLDPRVTAIGRVLRKYKLDELPQVINVLLGDMSFVGPRPELQRYTDLYTQEEHVILGLRPGITDWASLQHFDVGAELSQVVDRDRYYLEQIRPVKIRLQLKYLAERSFLVDIQLVYRTAVVFLRRLVRSRLTATTP